MPDNTLTVSLAKTGAKVPHAWERIFLTYGAFWRSTLTLKKNKKIFDPSHPWVAVGAIFNFDPPNHGKIEIWLPEAHFWHWSKNFFVVLYTPKGSTKKVKKIWAWGFFRSSSPKNVSFLGSFLRGHKKICSIWYWF